MFVPTPNSLLREPNRAVERLNLTEQLRELDSASEQSPSSTVHGIAGILSKAGMFYVRAIRSFSLKVLPPKCRTWHGHSHDSFLWSSCGCSFISHSSGVGCFQSREFGWTLGCNLKKQRDRVKLRCSQGGTRDTTQPHSRLQNFRSRSFKTLYPYHRALAK
jgi:hypothetical protein